MTENRKLVVVLGPHRSGTSLCAAAVAALGAHLGDDVTYANEENPKGFFEHPAIVDFNDRLLQHLGGSWDNPLFRGESVITHESLAQWQSEAVQLLRDSLGDAALVAVKDPRMCQLLAFWQPVFVMAGYPQERTQYIHTYRSVAQVAQSARTRAQKNAAYYDLGLDLAEGAALWFSLTAQSLLETRGKPNVFLAYEELLSRPRETLQRLADELGLAVDEQQITDFCERFVDPDLQHAVENPEVSEELANALPQALELEALIAPVFSRAETKPDYRAIRRVLDRRDTADALGAIMSRVVSRLASRAREDRLEALRLTDEVGNAQRQREESQSNARNMRLEHERLTENMRSEHAQVLAPLRAELEQMQQATQSQTEQLHRQSVVTSALREQLQATRVAFDRQTSEFRSAVVHHREVVGKLESEVAALRQQAGDGVASSSLFRLALEQSVLSPLRPLIYAIKGRIVQLRTRIKRLWMRFRIKAIEKYHGISMTHPGTAWRLRRVLRPAFKVVDWLLGDSPLLRVGIDTSSPSDTLRFQQLQPDESFEPLVSVIVPNYNHEPYLEQRLQSIYAQSYSNFEVILLDDASTDESVRILEKYRDHHPDKTILEVNRKNSGGVFEQWQRGLAHARGAIVWIAESDDWCSDNFLSELVPYFENEAVQLAYARTLFMDREGDKQVWSLEEYLHDLDPVRWTQAFVETGAAIVRDGFAIKNIVPNVSSALMRSPAQLEVLQDPQWRAMRTCGDWALYLHLLRGGMVAYTPRASNYYRMHGENTSVSSYRQDDYYREHEAIANIVNRYYTVDQEVFEQLRDSLGIHWRNTRDDFSQAAFDACFSLERIRAAHNERAPNILMASYAFCAGGGETFPVSLANIMKARGYNVTYLDCAQEPRMDGIRQRLRPDISIVSDFRQLERIVDAFDIDVIHSHHAWMEGTILNLLPEESPVRLIVTLHGMYETMNEYELKSILPRLARRVSSFIYVAEKNLTALRAHGVVGRVPTVRIDNALQEDPYEAIARADLGVSEDAFVLTLVSRGMAEKGWAEGIAAVGKAREISGRDIQLLLVGDGPEYERLSEQSQPDYIHLEGFQRNVRGYFAVADIGFLPSRFRGESFPLVIIECLQAGRPFLASDLGEIRRMLSSEAGMAGAVVGLNGESVDVEAVAADIARMASEPDYFAAMADAVGQVVQKFDPDLLAARHDEVYRGLAGADSMDPVVELAS
jgi:glycosyltransferase involved in cell wall biosynthesis